MSEERQLGMSADTANPSGQLECSVECGSRIEWIDPMQTVAERVFALAGFDDEQAYWPVMAVREAVMNAVMHGNQQDADRTVRVEYRVDQGRIEIKVSDQGAGFDPDCLRDPLSAENLLSEGGRGVYLMRQFMDEVAFSFPDAGGTCICLVKRLPGAESPAE